ncbi:hypothetical protein BJ138DRAFT_1149587 [Hygrophoropsis aurantiaca]|uniref:Uncharacterized protein n=1 Tax=Hygrophoropsis aurantiaca TaxID=72124 RepID=A0ACB8AF58_9AGAM|nr:hypothetical protein BJ138DRAFT_1149587 [Hygrophoropsis aurantiaca]
MATFYNLFKSPTMVVGEAYISTELMAGVLLAANIEIILMRRLFALFNYEKIVVIPITILYFIVFGFMIGMGIVEILDDTSTMSVFVGACVGANPGWFYMFWFPLMILDFILVVLVGYKSMQHYLRVPDKTWSGARLVRSLARDSFIYFLCNFSVTLAEVLLFRVIPVQYLSLGATWVLVIPPVAVNHLLINVNTAQTHVHTDDKESFYTNSAHEIRRAT